VALEEISRVYSEALFEAARDSGRLDVIHEQLGEFTDALEADRELSVFFFSPYFSTSEKAEGLDKALVDPDREFRNFLGLLIEKHRMPAIFRIRRDFDARWAKEKKLLEVSVTSAVELDPEILDRIAGEIERQTGQTVQLEAKVDDQVLGGLVLQVGNMVLDASVRSKLEKLRKSVAQAA